MDVYTLVMRECPGLCAAGTPISPPDQGAIERARLKPMLALVAAPDLAGPPVYAYQYDVTCEDAQCLACTGAPWRSLMLQLAPSQHTTSPCQDH